MSTIEELLWCRCFRLERKYFGINCALFELPVKNGPTISRCSIKLGLAPPCDWKYGEHKKETMLLKTHKTCAHSVSWRTAHEQRANSVVKKQPLTEKTMQPHFTPPETFRRHLSSANSRLTSHAQDQQTCYWSVLVVVNVVLQLLLLFLSCRCCSCSGSSCSCFDNKQHSQKIQTIEACKQVPLIKMLVFLKMLAFRHFTFCQDTLKITSPGFS